MPNDTFPRVSIRLCLIALLGLGALTLAAPRLVAQTAPVTGVPPLSTVQNLPEGTLNLGDLNLHVAVPIVSKAGRGAPFDYTLAFDSDVWTPVTNSTWVPAFNWGWTTETDAFTGYVTYQASPQQCAYGTSYPPQMYNFTLYENFTYYDQSGAAHPINMEPLQYPTGLPCGPNYPSSNSASAQDGSGLTLYASDNYGTPSATVVARSGAHISPPVYLAGSAAANGAGAFVDPNGNEITTNGSTFTDTLGVAELSVGGSGTPASPLTLSYPGPAAAKPRRSITRAKASPLALPATRTTAARRICPRASCSPMEIPMILATEARGALPRSRCPPGPPSAMRIPAAPGASTARTARPAP